jgi:transcriptional regulator with XRE-family HTH domain
MAEQRRKKRVLASKTIDPDKFMRSFSMELRKRRETVGISQEELAVRAGLHRTYVSDVECGARNISLRTLCLLSAALEMKPSELAIETEMAIERLKRRRKLTPRQRQLMEGSRL